MKVGKFYNTETPVGKRTIKCMQIIEDNQPYGGFSISNYSEAGDIQFMIIPSDSTEATKEQAQVWEAWYNSNV
jgi:hypothetical protein